MGCLTSDLGRVSRALPVQTATRNCTRDEGGPFGFGNQVLIPSHCKLLRSKAVVVSVAVKSGQEAQTARSREASASKPSMKCRKRIRRCQNRGMTLPPGLARGMPDTARAASGM
jgi:hypothetical protein